MSRWINETDVIVGARIRLRRKELGLTQPALAKQLGITFQQVQKYEIGANRIGAGRLEEIAKALEVPVAYFFDEQSAGNDRASMAVVLLRTHGAFELLTAYCQIERAEVRRSVPELARGLVRAEV